MTRKVLGKIESVDFGHCGYQECCIGISFTLVGETGGVSDAKCVWDPNMITAPNPSSNSIEIDSVESTGWTEKDRSKQNDEVMRYISDLLHQAKIHSLNDLQGVPVEITYEGNTLQSWRILTEVI